MPQAAPIPARLLTQVEFAKELGVSKQAVSDLLRRNVISRNEDGLIDAELAKLALQHRMRPGSKTASSVGGGAAASQPQAPGTPDATGPQPPLAAPVENGFNAARTEREWEEVAISRLRRQEMEGAVIERVPATRAVFTLARGLRDSLMPIGRRLAAKAAALTEPHAIDQLYTAELRAALDAFCAKALPQTVVDMAGDAGPKAATAIEPYRLLVANVQALQATLEGLKQSIVSGSGQQEATVAADAAIAKCRAVLDLMPLDPLDAPPTAHGPA
jgi:hypothetical protein